MNYLWIVWIVFGAIWGFFFLLLLHYIVFTIIGIFAKKTFPETEEKRRYGILIGARNEEGVIGRLLDSIRANDYPADKVRVFVVAHNCTDRTAAIARAKGATVYEYNNPAERVVGCAYRHFAERINAEGGLDELDGIMVINADNVLAPDYIARMNDAFVATGGEKVITSFRNSENFGRNYMTCLYGIFFIAACRFESRGRTVCGCSTRVSGTGFLFRADLLKEGWNYVTLTEDWEFSADRIARGMKVYYCDDAQLFDEQPKTIRIMLRQRLRWARGHTVVFLTRIRQLARSFFRPKSAGGASNKFSVFDISMTLMPLGVMGVSLGILQAVCVALAPLFGVQAAHAWWLFGVWTGITFGISYALTVLAAVFLVLLERRRIPKVRFPVMLAAVLLWPFFVALNVVLDVVSFFKKKLEWKAIPHGEDAAPAFAGGEENAEGDCLAQAGAAPAMQAAAESPALLRDASVFTGRAEPEPSVRLSDPSALAGRGAESALPQEAE